MMQLDDNLTLTDDGAVVCAHCETRIGENSRDPLVHAVKRERPSRDAGPGVHADPKTFTAREIVLRQFFCPGCGTVLATEIVPRDEPSFRRWSLDAQASAPVDARSGENADGGGPAASGAGISR